MLKASQRIAHVTVGTKTGWRVWFGRSHKNFKHLRGAGAFTLVLDTNPPRDRTR